MIARVKLVQRTLRYLAISLLGVSLIASGGPAGDVAPKGVPDGILNIADLILVKRFVYGDEDPDSSEYMHANVAPLDSPDSTLDIADLLLIERAIYGLTVLPPVISNPISISGAIDDTNTTLVAGQAYTVTGPLVVNTGATLTIPPGTIFVFSSPTHGLEVNGALDLQGVPNGEIVFTSGSQSCQADDWKGITINEGGASQLSLKHLTVKNAAHGVLFNNLGTRSAVVQDSVFQCNTYGVRIVGDSSPSVTGNDIHDNAVGVSLSGEGIHNPEPQISGNDIYNNQFNLGTEYYTDVNVLVNATGNWWGASTVVEIAATIFDWEDGPSRPFVDYGQYLDASVDAGGISAGPSLVGIVDGQLIESSYELLGNVYVAQNSTLEIPAGTTFVTNHPDYGFHINGQLDLQGTPENKITFTSTNPIIPTGAWTGLGINSGDASELTLEHIIVEKAASGIFFNDLGARSVILRNSKIKDNVYGVRVFKNSHPAITANDIHDNTVGVSLNGDRTHDPLPMVNGNDIYDNVFNLGTEDYDDQDSSDVTVDATGNWWGVNTVSSIAATIFDREDAEPYRPLVNYGQFLNSSVASGGNASSEPTLLGTISGSLTATRYKVLSDLYVVNNTSLNIPAGTTLVFEDPADGLYVDGSLIVQGVLGNEVVFTGIEGTTQEPSWAGITVRAGSGDVVVDHAVVEYAQKGIRVEHTGSARTIEIRNSLIHYNVLGIDVNRDSTPLILDNRIINNGAGVLLDGDNSHDPMPVINGNDIYNNDSHNLEAREYSSVDSSLVSVDATSNWWGIGTAVGVADSIFDWNDNQIARPTINTSSYAPSPLLAPALINQSIDFLYTSPGIVDSSQDIVHFSGTLNETSDWTAEVIDGLGTVMKSVIGTGTLVSIDWDGTTTAGSPASEGGYRLRIATVAASDVNRAGLGGLGHNIIDNTEPLASISSSSLISGVLSHDFVGSVEDANFTSYDLEYGNAPSPSVYAPIEMNVGSEVSESILGNLLVGTDQDNGVIVVDNGDYVVRLTARDRAGNAKQFVQTVTVDNLTLLNIVPSVNQFDLSLNEELSIAFNINIPGNVTLSIYDDVTGNLVFSKEEFFATPGPNSISWSGQNNSMMPVPNEAYTYTLHGENGARIGTYNPPVSEPNWAEIQWAQVGEFRPLANQHLVLNFSPNVPSRARIVVDAGTYGIIPQGTDGIPFLGGPGVLSWNGLDTVDRSFYHQSFRIGVDLDPLPSNAVIVSGSDAEPVIIGQSLTLEVKTDPYWLYLSYGQFTTIRYNLATPGGVNADVIVKLLPPGVIDFYDSSAIEVFNGSVSPGDNNIEWRGYDPAGADTAIRPLDQSGAHVFAIQATVNGVSTLYRGALNAYR